ncbi:MAG: hypothetical protein KAJ03_01620 [Gammaproteobacteria bacterium]|nr:hypothetical protein [Gammaproteobacteria bacterium]
MEIVIDIDDVRAAIMRVIQDNIGDTMPITITSSDGHFDISIDDSSSHIGDGVIAAMIAELEAMLELRGYTCTCSTS